MSKLATLPTHQLTRAAVAANYTVAAVAANLTLAAIGAGLLMIIAPTVSQANTLWEVESARGNARAGGPTNAFDADVLERYGALSGTPVRDWRTGRIIRESRYYNARRDRRRHWHD
jgi:hypothetical protein